MYKKEQFDIAIHYKNFALSKFGALDVIMISATTLGALTVAILFPGKNFYVPLLVSVFALAVIFGALFLRIYFHKKKKKIVLGLNKDGMYLQEYGFVQWGDVKDIVIGYDFGYRIKKRAIFFVPNDLQKSISKMPFFKKIGFKLGAKLKDFSEEGAIPGIYEFYVQEPLEVVLKEISDYVVNLDK